MGQKFTTGSGDTYDVDEAVERIQSAGSDEEARALERELVEDTPDADPE